MRDSEMKELEAFLKDGTTTLYEKYDALTDMYIEYIKLQEEIQRIELRKLRYEDILYNYTDQCRSDKYNIETDVGSGFDYDNTCRISKIMLKANERRDKKGGYHE